MTDEQRGWMVLVIAVLVAILLTGCATKAGPPPEPEIRVVETKVPYPVPCKAIEELGAEPVYPDTDKALQEATTIFDQTKLLLQGRLLRVGRLARYVAARASC